MLSTILSYTRMIIELLIALFLVGLLAAFPAGRLTGFRSSRISEDFAPKRVPELPGERQGT